MRNHAFALVVVCLISVSSQAAWVPPAGFTRTPNTFLGDRQIDTAAFAIAPDGKVAVGTTAFSGGANIKIYSSLAAAQAATSPIRTFTDPTYRSWGDLTFTDNDTLLISENGDKDTVYRAQIAAGSITPLAPIGATPDTTGVIQVGTTVYTAAAGGPGANALYAITDGAATAVITNAGIGYFGGVAVDSAGNFLLTDSNPDFTQPGRLLRYNSSFVAQAPINLASGNGSGAYDVVLDSEGDAFVTTGATLTQIPHGTTTAQQFGSSFAGSFAFISNLDFVGNGFEPNAGAGQLWINATGAADGAIIGAKPIPEPGVLALISIGALVMLRNRKQRTSSLAGFAVVMLISTFARADHFYATQIIDRQIGTEQQSAFTDPTLALGPPRGGGTTTNSLDVYCLGNGGTLTLGFDDQTASRRIANAAGYDFIVSENAFLQNNNPHKSFAELAWAEVSTDGVHFARFPGQSETRLPVGPFGTLDPWSAGGFVGLTPVLANVDDDAPEIDPFDPIAAGGDPFDLSWIQNDPLVKSGVVGLNNIRFIRLRDIVGDGASTDTEGAPIYDPTGPGVGGADIDSVAVIHGLSTPAVRIIPEPSLLLSLSGFALLPRRR